MIMSKYLRKPLMKYSVGICNKKIITRNISDAIKEKYDPLYKHPSVWIAIMSFASPLYMIKRLYNEKYPEKH